MDPEPQQSSQGAQPPPISFDDLGGQRVAPIATVPRPQPSAQPSAQPASRPAIVPPAPKPIDFSYLGGKRVGGPPVAAPAPVAPQVAPEPEDKGLAHQVIGAVKGPFVELGNTWQGIKGLFADPQEDHEKEVYDKWSAPPPGAEDSDLAKKDAGLQGKIALALYRVGHGFADQYNKGKAAEAAEDTLPGKVLAAGENAPVVGDLVKMMENKDYGQAFTQGLTRAALMRGGARAAKALPEEAAAAEAAIPKATEVAGTTLPETAGQAATRVNPTGIGSDVKGLEDVARKVPGSEKLRDVSTAQQGAAREILANKAGSATGASTSTAPEAIEQNATNAAEAARTAGSAKYEEIGKAANVGSGADFSKPVEAAHSILSDTDLAKLLPKSAREALGKVASSLSEREELARQIYGKAFSDLDPAKQTEVGKAMTSAPEQPAPFTAILKARSELGSAANSAKDAADARLLHMAHDQFDQAAKNALSTYDEVNGTNHTGLLKEADTIWSQKYAFENFRDKLQDIMRDQPHTGNREINGAAFQKLVNDLDPRGAKGTTQLQRMFPGDPQSVQDMHELADFMGKNQGGAGGMASSFAKLRILGLKESALGLIANTVGFSFLLSKPGLARALLTALKSGKDVVKASAAIGEINHAANLSRSDENALPTDSTASPTERTTTPTQQSAANDTAQNSTTPAANSNPSSITASGTNPSTPAVPAGRIAVSAPNGSTYHFPSQEAADAFKKAAGVSSSAAKEEP